MVTFGDSAGALISVLVISGFGLFFAGLTYALLVYPSQRRPEFRLFGGCSKRLGLGIALTMLAAVALIAYWSYLTVFFVAELGEREVVLRYRYPAREVRLTRQEIERLGRRPTPTKAGTRFSCLIYTRSGHRYESGDAKPDEFEANLAEFKEWLGQAEF